MPLATTLKLPEELKSRIVALATAESTTPHAFMVEALAAQTELAEKRRDFVAAAVAAEDEVACSGLVYDADEVFSYVRDKLAAKLVRRPAPVRAR